MLILDEKTKAWIQKQIQSGRGQGTGPSYQPWLRVGEFSSNGTSHRITYFKQNRVCHFFSSLEAKVFYQFEWADKIIDINEQYPLLPIEDTIRLAEQMGISYPTQYNKKRKTCQPVVMTTDFLVTFMEENGTTYQKAYSVKMSQDLDQPRMMEKQKLEAAYWKERGTPFSIITERELDGVKVGNLEFLYGYRSYEPGDCLLEDWISLLLECSNRTLNEVVGLLDVQHGLPKGTALKQFFTLAANKWIPIQLDSGILRATRRIEELVDMERLKEMGGETHHDRITT